MLGNFCKHWCALTIIFLITPIAFGASRDVCSTCTYTTISSAISAANSGDTVRVAAGTYNESISFSSSLTITLEGGWNSTFTTRNPSTYISTLISATLVSSNTSITLDGFTFTGSSTYGIYVNSTTGSLNVSNSIISNNADAGVYIVSADEVIINNNIITNNCSGLCYGGIIAGLTGSHTQIIVSENTIHSHTNSGAVGVMIWSANNSDAITGNLIYNNAYGINTFASSSVSAPTISGNTVYSNSTLGILLQAGSQNVQNNIIYLNAIGMQLAFPYNPSVINNVADSNTSYGIVITSSASMINGTFTNNIISNNSQYGFSFNRNLDGSGTCAFFPNSFKYNLFYGNGYSDLTHSGQSPYSFNSEIQGDYSDINGLLRSDYNMIVNPGFADAAAHDYHLSSNSFAIDHGSPSSIFSGEPSPNGGRIDIGAYGNTNGATNSPSAVLISNIVATQDGNDLDLVFDTTTPVSQAWISLEYWDGDAYQELPISSLSGSSAVQGYDGWRIETGSSRSITVQGINSFFDGMTLNNTKIQITLRHGLQSGTAESGSFNIDYAASTATPTPTNTHSPTPISTATSTPTNIPSPTLTNTPSITSTPTLIPTSEPPTTQPPKSPNIRAYSSRGTSNKRASLRYEVTDTDSSEVTIQLKIKRNGRVIRTNMFSASSPFSGRQHRTWSARKLRAGTYIFCMQARDEGGRRSRKSCNSLRLL